MANIIEIIIKANNQASGALDAALDKVSSVGKSMQDIGKKMTIATAPIALALGMAVNSAMAFDSSMVNTASVLGKSRTEMVGMNKEILKIGMNSRAGPQAAADAFYDIAGGVSDASSHMAILQASINTAEAGNADLGSTTNALIAVMNSYGFKAEDAAFASDVLTRTVGMGVGTMGDFASAMPAVTGLAHSLGIGFDDLSASAAYLTTQGNTASQSTTQLGGMMSALINPSTKMNGALQEMGFASGRAAVEQLGLVGTYQALIDKFGVDAVGPMVGQMEAVRGVTALTGAGFTEFSGKFVQGVNGATAAAQQIQLDGPAAQFDLLKSKLSTLGIEAGQILLPILNDLVTNTITPLVDGVMAWADANPEAAKTVLMILGAAVLAGPVIGGLGLAVSAVSTAVGILLAPAVLLAGAIGAIGLAAQIGYPGGIVGLFTDATKTAQQLAILGFYVLKIAADTVRTGIENVIGKVRDVWTAFSDLYAKSPQVRDGLNAIAGAALIVAGAVLAIKIQYGLMAIAQTIVTTGAWALATAKAALATAAYAASGGMTAFLTAASAAVLPLVAIAGAIMGIVLAVKNFNDVTAEARHTTGTQVTQMSASGQLTEQQLWEQAHKSAESQLGPGIAADIAARAIFNDLRQNMQAPGAVAGARAMGGDVEGGEDYLVGEKGAEIVHMPRSGTVIPNNRLAGAGAGGGDINLNGPMNFYGNTKAEGRAMADGLKERLDEMKRLRG